MKSMVFFLAGGGGMDKSHIYATIQILKENHDSLCYFHPRDRWDFINVKVHIQYSRTLSLVCHIVNYAKMLFKSTPLKAYI